MLKHFIIFWNILEHVRTFYNISEHSIIFWNIPEHSGTFYNILEHSIIFWNILWYSNTCIFAIRAIINLFLKCNRSVPASSSLSSRLSLPLKRYMLPLTSTTSLNRLGFSMLNELSASGSSPRLLYTFFSPVIASTNFPSSRSPSVWFFSHCRSFFLASRLSSTFRNCRIGFLTRSRYPAYTFFTFGNKY